MNSDEKSARCCAENANKCCRAINDDAGIDDFNTAFNNAASAVVSLFWCKLTRSLLNICTVHFYYLLLHFCKGVWLLIALGVLAIIACIVGCVICCCYKCRDKPSQVILHNPQYPNMANTGYPAANAPGYPPHYNHNAAYMRTAEVNETRQQDDLPQNENDITKSY